MATTINDLRADIDELGRLGVTDAYRTKQLHRIPVARVVDRVAYILQQCQGKRVLHLGCGWPASPLHQKLYEVTRCLDGIDINVPPTADGHHNGRGGAYWQWDLDRIAGVSGSDIPGAHEADVILAAELLEHLGNPGRLLQAVRLAAHPLIITVPNAYALAGRYAVSGGIENVNAQHVSYYSYWTLHQLVTRYGYVIEDWGWYNQPRNGQPQEAEGLIMVVR